MGKAIAYSDRELAWIERHRTLPRKEAHELFCREFDRADVTPDLYKALCTRKGWSTGRTGRIEKGNVPCNKGKKCEPGKGGNHPNARKSQFRKGQEPHNTHYLGHERVSKDGYVEISIDEVNPHTGYGRRYELKHKYLWEQLNGKVPEGMCLKNLDGNRQNTDPANWVPVPRGALPFLNGHRGYDYDQMPDELKPAVLALAKVKHAKSKAAKKAKVR
ncbi:HNH endonuclease [Tundrisphaera sp. TA3]|uniref:HNH endonuclease n=1 Tax=Tundrisphaera sp. TA3 TaxID=3435775 RepID=UPI003EBA2895